MRYQLMHWDPLTQSGAWRGTADFEDMLNEAAERGWRVKQVWGGDNPNHEPWFVLLEKEA